MSYYKSQDRYPQLIGITKPNSGHGATVLYAYKYAIQNGADYVFQTDSDGQTLTEEFIPSGKKESNTQLSLDTETTVRTDFRESS